MGWTVLLPALAVLHVFNKRVNPRKGQNAVAVITMLLAIVAGCGLAYTFAGQWLAGFVSWLGSLLSNLFGQNAAIGLSIGLTLLLVGVAVCDIAFDKRADKGAQIAAVLFPTLVALVIGGSMGKTGGDAVKTVNTQMASFVTKAGGK
jgi:hypothetical protein